MYQVNEIFHSVQGEGFHVGKPATFIRLQGCSVGCSWCDTQTTWKAGGEQMSAAEICINVFPYWRACDRPFIVITGGEPTLYDLDALLDGLRKGRDDGSCWPYIQLETSGQNNLKGSLLPDWVTWSPKKNLEYCAPETLLGLVDEVKFVVDDDLTELQVVDIDALFRRKYPHIVLMPEGCPPTLEHMRKAYEWVLRHPAWRVIDRLQYRLGVK